MSLQEQIIQEKGQKFWDQLDPKIKKEVRELDKVRRISEKKKITAEALLLS